MAKPRICNRNGCDRQAAYQIQWREYRPAEFDYACPIHAYWYRLHVYGASLKHL